MPGMDGFELATAVRADVAARDTLLIALLSIEADIQHDRLRSMGFAGFLTKPVRQSILFDTIMDAMSAAKKRPSALPPDSPGKAAAALASAPPGPARRILLAEDNEINRTVASEILRKAGYQCVPVPNGQLAVEAVKREPFDLVLMDCQMPVMDGFDATRAIRRWESEGSPEALARGHIPIIASSHRQRHERRPRSLPSGRHGHLCQQAHQSQAAPGEHRRTAAPRTRRPKGGIGHRHESPRASRRSRRDASNPGPATTGDPIDAGVLMEMCMDDAALAGTVLATFEEQALANVSALRDGSGRADAKEIARVAHAMRGTAGTIGAASMMNSAQRLEQAALEGNLAEVRRAVDLLAQDVQRCLASLPKARAAIAGIARKNSGG